MRRLIFTTLLQWASLLVSRGDPKEKWRFLGSSLQKQRQTERSEREAPEILVGFCGTKTCFLQTAVAKLLQQLLLTSQVQLAWEANRF